MTFLNTGRLFLLSAALFVPGLLFGQSAPTPPAEATPAPPALALPAAPAQEPAIALPGTPPPTPSATQPRQTPRTGGGVVIPPQDPTSPAAPPRATRARSVPAEPTAPAITTPVWSPSGTTYYTQTAPYYRYTTPLDKEMQELVKKEQELAKKTTELVGSLKGATTEKKTEIKTQLIASVEAHFAVRQEQRELQLKRIEEEVKKLREAIEKRNTSKKEIIERRIAELTGEDTIGF